MNKRMCEKNVSDHTGFHWFPCSRAAKFIIEIPGRTPLAVCGIHVRRYRDGNSSAYIKLINT